MADQGPASPAASSGGPEVGAKSVRVVEPPCAPWEDPDPGPSSPQPMGHMGLLLAPPSDSSLEFIISLLDRDYGLPDVYLLAA